MRPKKGNKRTTIKNNSWKNTRPGIKNYRKGATRKTTKIAKNKQGENIMKKCKKTINSQKTTTIKRPKNCQTKTV